VKRPSTRKGRIYATLAALAATFLVVIPLAVTAPGCGLQAEGQRCSKDTLATHDGSDDCGEGLYCTTVLGANTDICCPKGASENANCQAQVGGTTSSGGTSASVGASTSASTSTSASASTSTGTGAGGGSSTGTSTSTGAGGADGGV
jgi:hypothetical protein